MTREQAAALVQIKPDTETRLMDGSRWPGRKIIFVGDIQWGYITMERTGPHGSVYFFHQTGDGRIEIHTGNRHGVKHYRPVRVESDKMYQRRMLPGAVFLSLEVRLLNKAAELIRDGHLMDPEAVKERQRRAHEHFVQSMEKAKAVEHANFEARARQTLANGLSDPPSEALVASVVDAMKWAQSQ